MSSCSLCNRVVSQQSRLQEGLWSGGYSTNWVNGDARHPSAVERARLQNELLQQPVPQLASTAKMLMIIITYPFEILNVHERKSINWAPNDFSARGKDVVSLLTILPDPACPAGTVLLVWLPQACRYPVF